MNLELFKVAAVRLAPIVIGAIIGVGGTKAMETKTSCPEVICQKVLFEVKCDVPIPPPIKVQFLK